MFHYILFFYYHYLQIIVFDCIINICLHFTFGLIRVEILLIHIYWCNLKSMTNEFRKCSQCKAVFYCSKKCQKLDWKHIIILHKLLFVVLQLFFLQLIIINSSLKYYIQYSIHIIL